MFFWLEVERGSGRKLKVGEGDLTEYSKGERFKGGGVKRGKGLKRSGGGRLEDFTS